MGDFNDLGEFYTPPQTIKTKGERAGLMEYLPSALLTIVLIIISGLGTLVQFNFSIKNIVFTTFIVSLSLRLVTVYSAKYVGSNLKYNKSLYTDDFKNIQKELIETGKDVDKAEFDRYVKDYNLKLKKEAYIKKKRGKIARLGAIINKLSFKNELSFSKWRDNRINRKLKKIEELEKVSTKEYIDANIIYIRVKYRKVRSCYFFSVVENNYAKGRYYNVNVSKEISKEIAKSLPITVMLVLLGSLMMFSATMGVLNLISFFYDVAVMIINFVLGWFVVGKKAIASTVNAFINRIIFIKEFKNERENKKAVEVVEKNSNQ